MGCLRQQVYGQLPQKDESAGGRDTDHPIDQPKQPKTTFHSHLTTRTLTSLKRILVVHFSHVPHAPIAQTHHTIGRHRHTLHTLAYPSSCIVEVAQSGFYTSSLRDTQPKARRSVVK